MDAVINLDKPLGITSQDAVTLVKRSLGVARAGHAGTLDPLATGVLLVLTGEATKLQSMLMGLPKEYRTTIKLGERTDTYDSEGAVVERAPVPESLGRAEIESVLAGYRGEVVQRPPVYSALKVAGRPLYEYARKGIEVEVKERTVRIDELSLEGLALPFVTLRVRCSKGTYIRSLADDIGRDLGVFGHVAELKRTRVGGFGVEDSVGPEGLNARGRGFHSAEDAVSHLRDVVLEAGDYRLASCGGAVSVAPYGDFMEGEFLRVKSPAGEFFALGEAVSGRVRIARILHLGTILKPVF